MAMKILKNHSSILSQIALVILFPLLSCAQERNLKEHLLFYSSFDNNAKASIAKGDARIFTAENYKESANAIAGIHDKQVVIAKNQGLSGDALHFKVAKTSAIFYKAYHNVGYDRTSWSGTISFWLRLDPNAELPPHYCDPICITDSSWNDAGLWVDFTDHSPRKFRMGAMGDKAVWDPNNDSNETDWNQRTVTVDPAPFDSEKWTHVAMVFDQVNTASPSYSLYLNGNLQGQVVAIKDPFSWNTKNGKIMLGLGYIGFMDELAVFSKPLSSVEIKKVFQMKHGLMDLN